MDAFEQLVTEINEMNIPNPEFVKYVNKFLELEDKVLEQETKHKEKRKEHEEIINAHNKKIDALIEEHNEEIKKLDKEFEEFFDSIDFNRIVEEAKALNINIEKVANQYDRGVITTFEFIKEVKRRYEVSKS